MSHKFLLYPHGCSGLVQPRTVCVTGTCETRSCQVPIEDLSELGSRHESSRHDRLAILSGVPVPEAAKDHKALALPRTYLIDTAPQPRDSKTLSAVELRDKLRVERTNLVPRMLEAWEEIPVLLQEMQGNNPLYGYIGMDDYTLHPFIRPGSFVRIDPRQKKIPPVNWHTDHDRPVFFVELRERYVCSWCEMHDGQLILIPSQQSKRRAQHVRYPADATIIGRVTAIAMSIVEGQPA
jgi:hypothetical protein